MVGIAYLTVSHGEASLTQVCDNPSYVKTINSMRVMRPSTILFMTTVATSNPPNTLFNLVNQFFPHAKMEMCERNLWSSKNGQEYVNKLAVDDDLHSLNVALEGKTHTVCSFAAVR